MPCEISRKISNVERSQEKIPRSLFQNIFARPHHQFVSFGMLCAISNLLPQFSNFKNHFHKDLFIKTIFKIIMSLCPLFHPLNVSYPQKKANLKQKNQFLHKGLMKNNKFPNLLTRSLTISFIRHSNNLLPSFPSSIQPQSPCMFFL